MEHCVGVVLSVLAFRESDQIVTIFSPEGLIKLFVKRKRLPLMAPLTEGEFLFVAGRGDLYRFRDGTILNQNLKLRERLENLEAASRLVQAILKSQWPGKDAPRLYHLFCYFLRLIPEVEQPEELASVFFVKTLKHEGLFQQTDRCCVCEKEPNSRFGGERFCKEHAPIEALQLTAQEEKRLVEIAEGRSLKELLTEPFEQHDQVATLFDQAFS